MHVGALLILFAFASTQTPAVKDLVRDAARARDSGDLELALSLLRQAYNKNASPRVLHNIGRVLEDLGRYREAAESYEAVIRSAGKDRDLETLDRARLSALAPKLEQVSLKAELDPARTIMLIDGTSVPDVEFTLSPGEHAIELKRLGSQQVILRFRAFPPGRRISVREDQLATVPDDAFLSTRSLRGSLARIAINGYAIRAPLDALEAVALAPGDYRIELTDMDQKLFSLPVSLTRGEDLDLGSRVAETRSHEILSAAPTVPAAGPSMKPPTEAVGTLSTEPASGSPPWPAITTAGGAIVTGVGVLFLVAASNDRSRVTNAARDPLTGQVIGLTYREASDLEASMNHKQLAGGVSLAAGVLAVAGGLVWWALGPSL